jgi:hypothetical protein
MKQQAVIFFLFTIFIFSAGCTNVLPPVNSTGTPFSMQQPTSATHPPARYGYGDVVSANTGDEIGEVIITYDPVTDVYSSRSVIFDQYGQVFYYQGGRTIALNRANFEYQYPHKRATVNNPQGLQSITNKYSPGYGVGSVVQDPNNPGAGIKIVAYDYPRDVYTYSYVSNRGGAWVSAGNETYEGARTDIEQRYKPK